MKNILIVSVNWLGDAVFSTPVFAALKKHYPGARLTVLAVPRVVPVLALSSSIDEIIVYDEVGEDRPLVDKLLLVSKLRRQRFDAVFFLRPSFSRAFLTLLAGIPLRIGFKTRNFPGLINRAVNDQGLDQMHRADAYLSLLERYGIPVHQRFCALQLKPDHHELAQRMLLPRGVYPHTPYCVLNTGGNWDLKQWPVERFADLTRRIVLEKNWSVVFTGAAGDADRVARIIALSGVTAVDLTGQTDIEGTAAVFLNAQVLISADSGPLHLASALGVRTIAIFGPTRVEITGPRGQGRSSVLFNEIACNKAPCYYLECPENRCMKTVEVEDVIRLL